MADVDKVIKAYECCKNPIIKGCERCPYEKICYHDQFCLTAIKDAIELLKEQKELIRCKDCNNGVIHCENGDIICDHVDSSGNDTHPADWFCADGEHT